MATPAHARMACPEQTKNPDGSGDQEGPESSLKNGTTFDDSEDSGGSNIVMKNRGSSQHGGGRETAPMESFQDGGSAAPQTNSRPASGINVDGGFPANMDRSRMNSDFQSFNQSSNRDGVPNPMMNDDFRSGAPEGYNHGCELGYTRSGYVSDLGNSAGDISTNSQPNKMYPQYNQAQMRPSYGQSPRNMAMGPQQRPPGPTVGRYPTNTSQQQQQQRFLLGPSIAQPTGPTPTLNQLLQAPNSLQRYHNSYDYSSNQGLQKNIGEVNPSQYAGPNNTWGSMRASGYQQAHQMGSSMYRNQGWHGTFETWLKQPKTDSKHKRSNGGPTLSDPSMKRPYGGQMSSPTSGPSPQGGQQQQQYQPQQGGPMSDPSMKRPYPGPTSGQMSSTTAATGPSPQGTQQYPPQQYHQYGQQSQGTPVRPSVGQAYPQQGVQQYSGVQQAPSQTTPSQPPGYDHQRQVPLTQYSSQSHMQQQQQQQQTPLSQQQQPQHQHQPQQPPTQHPQQQQQPSQITPAQQQTPQQSQQQQPMPSQQQQQQQQSIPSQQQQQQPPQQVVQQTSVQDAGGSGSCSSGSGGPEDVPSTDPPPGGGGGSGSTTPGLRAPTTPPHPVVSPHRPVPSPSGPPSVGSPSMSSTLGQQQNIPMPPRPSSSQPENSGPSSLPQPPMAGAQGYNQQMAPPAMYGSKMHQGMMGATGSQAGPYSHQPSGHYAQSTYHRPANSAAMQGYSGQSQSSYPNPVPGPTYPPQSSVSSQRMPSSQHTSAAPANFSSPSPAAAAAYSNSQYGNSGPPPSSGYMNNMMPPPNQYPNKTSTMPPPTGGAQAAAQAAVMAAAASSGGIRQSPMYLRQHLQQKMYAGNYSGSSISPVPPGAPGSTAPMVPDAASPMPPPATTPSSQPLGMSQTSPMPPQASTPGAMASGSSCDNSVPSTMALAGFTQTSAPSLGPPPTTITQSISSPVPSAVTVSSPSVMGSDMMQSQQSRVPIGVTQGPPPPPIIDEGSQASNASASSSLPEERVETPKPNSKPTMSHPPTPNTLSSPGAASMSSFHDEFESVSSPSWPRTPASPVINNQAYDHHPIKRPDGMLKLYDMSDDPDRRVFLDKLIMYNEERGTPISQCPTISKQPLDLFRLYLACKERGGFVEVMKAKLWKDIAGLIGIGASSSAAYTLRKQYIKHLLPFECKYDRGGIDPGPLISSLESNSRKKNAAKNSMMNQEGYHQGGPMMDGYGSYPGGYPPSSGPHPGMMSNADYPGGHHPPYNDPMHPGGPMVNHSGSEGAMDPFSDEMPSSQYSQRHSSGEGYGYTQPSNNSSMPPYSGNQSNMTPSGQYGYNSAPVGQQEPYGEQYSNNMGPPSSESSYGNQSIASDPYSSPGGYPPNRTVGSANQPTYPPYQAPCDQDRYDQPAAASAAQGPMMRPQSASSMGPSPQETSGYPPHRYLNPAMSSRENIPAQQMGSYQGRPTMPQSQYQGPNSQSSGQASFPQSQQDSYRGSDYPNYPSNQQGMYGQSMPPPNKVAPPGSISSNMYQRDMYPMGPKRHGDFSKPHGPAQDQYHMGSYPQQQTQGPYADRSQYPYRPTHGVPPPSGPQPGWTRDGRPYASGPNHYQSNHRDGWDVSRHGEGPPPGSGNWPRYSGPQQDLYSQHMGPSMGPKMAFNRGYMSPSKMPQHPGVGPPSQFGSSPARKEIIFPPDSVEAVTPVMTKRRRLQAKDLATIDPWRVMMALKSGLLCESTWALDVLSVLICDDTTVLYFGLSHMPGLLEILMDHYRRCLNLVFDLLEDLEVGFVSEEFYGVNSKVQSEQKWYELDRDIHTTDESVDHSKKVLSGDSTLVLDSPNYTHKSRCRKYIRTQQEEALFLFDPDKNWDVYEGFMSGNSHWQHGGGESTLYIQTHFENDERNVRFVRIMEEARKRILKREESSEAGHHHHQETCAKDNPSCDDGQYCKKECNSDTEEDEGSCVNMPSPDAESKNTGSRSPNCKDVAERSEDAAKNSSSEETSDVELDGSDKDAKSDSVEKQTDDESSKSKEEKRTENECDASGEAASKVQLAAATCRKRKSVEEMEDESYNRDEPSLCITTDAQDALTRRCICISSLLRNLSFVPGNDTEMSKHAGFLMVMGRLLLLNHVHSPRKPPQRHYDREEESESTSVADSCSSLSCDHEWWWDMLHLLRENTLVTLANIAGQLDLAPFPEEISFPLLDGLMHWVTCPSSYAQDPLPTQPSQSVLSPQRLSLEALCKLSVLESNVDLMMATPPWQRINRFFSLLAKWLSRNEDQVLREFSVVLLSNLSQADSSMARAIALQGTCIPLLITFVEQAEQSALQVANSQGINALRENPELMGTTLDMVRRAAGTLRCLARVPSNRTLFLQHQQRLLALVMSQILDQGVASIIADVLFECSQEITDEPTTCAASGEKPAAPSSPAVAAT